MFHSSSEEITIISETAFSIINFISDLSSSSSVFLLLFGLVSSASLSISSLSLSGTISSSPFLISLLVLVLVFERVSVLEPESVLELESELEQENDVDGRVCGTKIDFMFYLFITIWEG